MTWLVCHGWRVVATFFGIGLTGVEIVLNAGHQAGGGNYFQPMVIAVVIITAAGAAAIPIAKRAWRAGAKWEAAALAVAFLPLVLAISFTSVVDRVSSRKDGEVAATRASSKKEGLAQTLYDDAVATRNRDCEGKRNGSPACKRAEAKVADAGKALGSNITEASQQLEDGLANRLAGLLSSLGATEEWVRRYVPLLLPTALLLGGFLFLAIGLAPLPGTPVLEAPRASLTIAGFATKAQALERLTQLAMRSKAGHRFMSVRGLAQDVGAHPASFHLWFREWRSTKFVVDRDGKAQILRLAKIRVVA